jgi:hypothetical protein
MDDRDVAYANREARLTAGIAAIVPVLQGFIVDGQISSRRMRGDQRHQQQRAFEHCAQQPRKVVTHGLGPPKRGEDSEDAGENIRNNGSHN